MMVADEREAGRRLQTLEQLLAIDATDVRSALEQASGMVARALDADKVDVFLLEPSTDTLVAVGVSDTPMGEKQRHVGLDRLPIANGGRTVEVYQTGESYLTGCADQDPQILAGVKDVLHVRSMMNVPLAVDGDHRGVLSVASAKPDAFTHDDLQFLTAVARWVGMIAHRAELVEHIRRDAVEQGRQVLADELITVLAHDLGNYVTPVRGRIELLRRRLLRENREREVVDTAEALRGLDRIQKLIANMLDASRLEQGLFAVEQQLVDLTALVRETVSLMRTKETDIRVQASDEVMALADAERIRQVVENLLANGLKYAPWGSTITVGVGQESTAAGCRAVISVRDEGPGIPPDLLPRIFGRFSSGPESKGLGLGLYLARGIAEAHGGSLTAESEPGHGATFRLSLPCGQT